MPTWTPYAATLLLVLGCGRSDPPSPAAGTAHGDRTASAPTPLRGSDFQERSLLPGGFHTYALEVPPGGLVTIEINSPDSDLVATLHAADGPEIARLVTPDFNVAETLLAISETAATLRLEIRADGESTAPGSYRLALTPLRPATATDRMRLAAQRQHAEGLALSTIERTETNQQAFERFEQASAGWRQAGDLAGTARSLLWSGLMLKDLNRYGEAEERLLEALGLWREAGSRQGEAVTLYRLGTLYRLWGRLEPAREAFDAALLAFRLLGDRRNEARTLDNQGLVHWRLASLQEALELYDDARAIWQELGDRRMEARTANNVAVVWQALGEGDRAIAALREALAIYEEEGDAMAQQAALNNLGWIHHKLLGKPRAAAGYFERALRLAEQSEDKNYQAGILINLARARVDMDETQKALAEAGRARRLAVEIRHPDYEVGSLIVAGQARQERGHHAAAAAVFEQALALGRPLGLRSREAEALFRLARVRQAQAQLDTALDTLGQALSILESVRTDVDHRSLKSSFLAFRRPYYELEVELRVELARRDPGETAAGQALAAAERARARGLLELLAEAGTDLSRGVDPALLDEERRLRQQVNEEDLRRWNAEGREREAARQRLEELFDRLERLEARIRERSPHYAALARPRPMELARLREDVLDDDSLLLEYSLGTDRGFLFAVTRSSIEIFDLPPLAVLEDAARDVYEQLIDHQRLMGSDWRQRRDSYRQAARRLAEMLLAPLAGKLDGQRLLIAAEGPLHFIPFAALPAPGGGEWRPLLLDHEIVHLPSASAIAVLRRQLAGRAPAPHALAVFADPVFTATDPRLAAATTVPAVGSSGPRRQRFERLPHSRREAESIAAMVDPSERWIALGFDASRATVMGPRLARYRRIHFATHGFLNSRTPRLSGLALSLVDESGAARDGFLRLNDVYELELGAELVVLSACRTALGRQIRGEGLVGLVRGFLHSGARGVVASLWRIEDEATAKLMERLHAGLVEDGLGAPAALRRAQLEMLHGDHERRWRAPFFWAAFVMQGDWRAPEY